MLTKKQFLIMLLISCMGTGILAYATTDLVLWFSGMEKEVRINICELFAVIVFITGIIKYIKYNENKKVQKTEKFLEEFAKFTEERKLEQSKKLD